MRWQVVAHRVEKGGWTTENNQLGEIKCSNINLPITLLIYQLGPLGSIIPFYGAKSIRAKDFFVLPDLLCTFAALNSSSCHGKHHRHHPTFEIVSTIHQLQCRHTNRESKHRFQCTFHCTMRASHQNAPKCFQRSITKK
jgi:hypothetical protein